LTWQTALVAILLGYFLGSIPFGLVLTRAIGVDVRSIGSGNIGATNVLRTGNKPLAAATLILDVLKGGAAVLIARYLWGDDAAMVAGLAAFAGHILPVWLGFKGGKGVATYIGVLLALNWIVGLIFCATWLLIAVARRYSSLASLTAAATAPIFAYVVPGTGDLTLPAACAVMSVILMLTHRENIMRLWNNTESKIGQERPKAG
jgi:acyl phosphate:glycerol-3-phosphate acyltransferase